MTDGNWSGGLARSCDYIFPARPDDPEMRESNLTRWSCSFAVVLPAAAAHA